MSLQLNLTDEAPLIVCDEWWHGWCLGIGWDERDEIPEVVECWTCDRRMREATDAADGHEDRQKALSEIGAKLKRLALKRRCESYFSTA